MNEREIADWEREIKHAKVMQEQRKNKHEGWDGRTHVLHGEQKRYVEFCSYKLMEKNNNEINN